MTLQDNAVIITGGAGGIGQGIVRHLVAEGARVLIVDIIDAQDGESLAAEISPDGRAVYLRSDIADPANAPRVIQAAVDAFGRLDALVNNAHASKQAPILETTQEMWDLSLNTGMFATFHLMKAAHAALAETKGAIVNFASGAGLKGLPTQVTYAAAKEAIRAITRVAAHEWAADGIRVNLVSPIALTPGIRQWSEAFPDDYQKVVDGIPLGRLGDPESDIAPIVAFLIDDASSYMTGQTLMADGGSIMLH